MKLSSLWERQLGCGNVEHTYEYFKTMGMKACDREHTKAWEQGKEPLFSRSCD